MTAPDAAQSVESQTPSCPECGSKDTEHFEIEQADGDMWGAGRRWRVCLVCREVFCLD